MKLTSVISLRDNYSAVMQRVEKNTKTFSRSVETVKKQLDAEARKQRQIRMDSTPAMKVIKDLEKRTKAIRNTAIMVTAQTLRFKEQFDPVVSKIKWATKAPFKLTFKMVDLASSGLKNLFSMVQSLTKPLMIGGGLAAAGSGALITASLKGAALLEQQQISMSHFIGVNNPKKGEGWANSQASGYLQSLRKNADLTPFGTDEVISTGTRAVGIASGNTKSAMSLLRLSEDMTALTPGKTLSDAIEALADLATGETERMKEFGFKISQAQVKAAGGDWSKIKNSSGISLTEMFRGGSDKLGTSASGLWSTITGTMKTGVTNMGVKTLNFLKPELQKWANYMSGGGANKLFDAGSNLMLSLFKSVKAGVDNVGSYLNKHFFNNPEFKKQTTFSSQVEFIFNDLSTTFKGWWEDTGKEAFRKVATDVGNFIGTTIEGMSPVIKSVGYDLGTGLIAGLWDGIKDNAFYFKWEKPDWWKAYENGDYTKMLFGGSPDLGKPYVPNLKYDPNPFSRAKNEKDAFEPKSLPTKAIGMRYIPQDNYPVLLHQGERVLTAQENRSSSKSSRPIVININDPVVREEADFNRLLGLFRRELENADLNGGYYDQN